LLTPRAELAAAVSTDGLIYVVGGTNQSSGFNPDTVGDFFEAYNPASGSWTSLAPMSVQRIFPGLAAGPDGRIYAVGGFDPNTLQEVTIAEAYSPATNTWTLIASPPLQDGFGLGSTVAATGKDGKIYAFFHSFNNAGETYTVLAYDPVSTSWTTGASVNVDNSGPTSATLGGDGRIYVLEGFTYPLGPGTTPSPKIEAYNPASNTWAAIPDDPIAQPLGAMAEGADGKVYVMGGEAPGPMGGSILANVNVYDPSTNAWSAADNLPTGREQLAAVGTSDGHVYAIGGSTLGDFTTGLIGEQASGEVDILATGSNPTDLTPTAALQLGPNNSFHGTVATFTDSRSSAPATAYSAMIYWGDGSRSPGTISGAGQFVVNGTHAFAAGFSQASTPLEVVLNGPNGVSTAAAAGVLVVTPQTTFVENLYLDLLHRQADPAGLASWIGQLNAGVTRVDIARAFERSPEYATNTVDHLYATLLNRAPDQGGLNYFVALLEQGAPFKRYAFAQQILNRCRKRNNLCVVLLVW
jgi:N-acetylneuraminic acid mutarotase